LIPPHISIPNSPQQSLQDQQDNEINKDEEPQPESFKTIVFETLMDQLEMLYPILDDPDLSFSVSNDTPHSSAAYKRAVWVEDI